MSAKFEIYQTRFAETWLWRLVDGEEVLAKSDTSWDTADDARKSLISFYKKMRSHGFKAEIEYKPQAQEEPLRPARHKRPGAQKPYWIDVPVSR